MRIFLVLVVLLALGAYLSKPGIAMHQKVAAELFAQGKAAAGPEPRTNAFEDMYVLSKYTALSNKRPMLECWGAFTRFLCVRPKES